MSAAIIDDDLERILTRTPEQILYLRARTLGRIDVAEARLRADMPACAQRLQFCGVAPTPRVRRAVAVGVVYDLIGSVQTQQGVWCGGDLAHIFGQDHRIEAMCRALESAEWN